MMAPDRVDDALCGEAEGRDQSGQASKRWGIEGHGNRSEVITETLTDPTLQPP